jgi:molybdopterin converting factor subunit 1
MNYRLLYFASLADRTGCSEETLESEALNAATLYEEVRVHHALQMKRDRLRVAVNGRFVDWNHSLGNGDEVAFLPPVSGG